MPDDTTAPVTAEANVEWQKAQSDALKRALAAEAERDLLRETLAESDLGALTLAQWEAIAAADADRDRLEAERDALKAAIRAALEVRQTHHRSDHAHRLLDPNCTVCRIELVLSRETPAKPDSREELSLLARATRAEAAIERVRKLHHRIGWDGMARDPYCAAEGNPHLSWPCPTIAALDAPETPGDAPAKPKHIGGRANAEDCPACTGDLPYPWICPGEPETPGDAEEATTDE